MRQPRTELGFCATNNNQFLPTSYLPKRIITSIYLLQSFNILIFIKQLDSSCFCYFELYRVQDRVYSSSLDKHLYFFINVYMALFLFNNVIYVFLLYDYVFFTVCLCITTLTEVFPCFFLSCKANARVKPAKTGHGPHSS